MKAKRILYIMIAFVIALSIAVAVSPTESYAATKHTHQYGAWKTTKKATCKKAGQKVRTCKICKAKQKASIAKTSHKYGAWKTTKKATCKKAGQKERTCKTCKAKQKASIAKTSHSYGAWKTTKKATCSAVGQMQRTCKNCKTVQKQEIAKLSHNYGAWTTTKAATCTSTGIQQRTCSVCKAVETQTTAKLSHNYGAWTTTKAATCTATGIQQRTCSVCKAAETRTIAKTSHNYGAWTVVKKPTCVANGTEQRVCSACQASETRSIAAGGEHNWASEPTIDRAATCTTPGSKSIHCLNANCTAKKDIESIPATGHSYAGTQTGKTISAFRSAGSAPAKTVVESKDADGHILANVCVNCNYHAPLPKEQHQFRVTEEREPKHNKEVKGSYPGSRKYTCDVCGYSYSEVIPAKEHQTEVIRVVEPTCTMRGKVESECTICGQQFFSLSGDPLGHNWSEKPVVDREATCTKDGLQSLHCQNEGCTETTQQTVIKARGKHEWNDWQTEKEPTCTAEGVKTRTCKYCSEKETQSIPSLGGHNYTNGEQVVMRKATCTEDGMMGRRCVNKGCTSVKAVSTISKTGHKWQDTITVEPTCTEPGEKTRSCSVCGLMEKGVQIPAGGGSHDWSAAGEVVQGGENSCEPTVEYKECSREGCSAKEYITVSAGSGHDWVQQDAEINYAYPGEDPDMGKYMRCSKCGKYQPGCSSLNDWDTPEKNRKQAGYSYRCAWFAYFTTDLTVSEGFNNHLGLKCASVGETRIVGGSSGYADNNYTTIKMKAPAPREGYRFAGWKLTGAADDNLIKEAAKDGRYRVDGDVLILNWLACDMSFTPVYEEEEAAKISQPEMTPIPGMSAPEMEEAVPETKEAAPETVVPGTESNEPESEIVEPEEKAPADDAVKPEDPAGEPEKGSDDPPADEAA